MNKTAYLLAASVALIATTSTAYAAGQIYGKLGANMSSGPSVNSNEDNPLTIRFNAKSDLMPEFALGYDWGDGFTVEFNYQKSGGVLEEFVVTDTAPSDIPNRSIAYHFRNTTDGDLVFTSTMVKGIYNIQTNNTGLYNPYIGFGIGITNIHLDKATYTGLRDRPALDGSARSMQFTFGNRFKFSQGWFGDIAANYTHVNAATLTYSDNESGSEKISSSKVTSISFALGKSF